MPGAGSDNAIAAIQLASGLGAGAVNAVGATTTPVTLPDPSTGVSTTTVTLAASPITITLPVPGAGKRCDVLAAQDATGSRLVTWATPSGAVRWPGAAPPTLTVTAAHVDRLTFACLDGVNWVGHADLNVG
jgi:hypothetical protein